MISEPGGPFIDVSKLNFGKYAGRPSLAKPLFMYLFHHENDVKNVSFTGLSTYNKPLAVNIVF